MESKNSLEALDICCIIEACSEYGVSHFTLGDLRIVFGKKTVKAPENPIPSTTTLPDSGEIDKTDPKPLLEDEVLTKEDQLEHMKIMNPSEFEELIMSGELEDDGLSESEES